MFLVFYFCLVKFLCLNFLFYFFCSNGFTKVLLLPSGLPLLLLLLVAFETLSEKNHFVCGVWKERTNAANKSKEKHSGDGRNTLLLRHQYEWQVIIIENGERNMKHSEFALDCVFVCLGCILAMWAPSDGWMGKLHEVEEIRNAQLVLRFCSECGPRTMNMNNIFFHFLAPLAPSIRKQYNNIENSNHVREES